MPTVIYSEVVNDYEKPEPVTPLRASIPRLRSAIVRPTAASTENSNQKWANFVHESEARATAEKQLIL